LIRGNHEYWRTVGYDDGKARLRVSYCQRNEERSDPQTGESGDYEVDGIGDEEGDSVTFNDSAMVKASAESGYLVHQFGVTQFAFEVLDGRLIGFDTRSIDDVVEHTGARQR
jgi:hypothetical protein